MYYGVVQISCAQKWMQMNIKTIFWVLFSILLFGGLFGFVGMIIAVPLMAVIIHIYNQIQEYLLSKKSLSIKEEDYVNLKRIDEQNGEYKKHGDEQ